MRLPGNWMYIEKIGIQGQNEFWCPPKLRIWGEEDESEKKAINE